MEAEATPLIFISYASPDRERVLPFYDYLSSKGFDVWVDVRRIKAGQNWDFEIKKALNKASLVVIFVSARSVDRRGYVQREMRLALEKIEEKLVDDIYAIPVLLDDEVPFPEQLKGLHFTRASLSDCMGQIEDAIRHQLTRLGAQQQEIQEQSDVKWVSSVHKEEWNGAPGYEVEYQILAFSSPRCPGITEIGVFLQGVFVGHLMEERLVLLEEPDGYCCNFGQDKWRRINTYEARCADPILVGKVISLIYDIFTNRAGAAHPYSYYETFCFMLEPVVRIDSLKQIFKDPDQSLLKLQHITRAQLLEVKIIGEDTIQLDAEEVHEGTKEWTNFKCFAFDGQGIRLMFPPYQVAAYCFGPQAAKIGYGEIIREMLPVYVSALGIERFLWQAEQTAQGFS